MPRSSSLCSQQSGQAPEVPMPPLPIELSTKEAQPENIAYVSLLSDDTSVLDESLQAFSHAKTDFTSSLTSPLGSHSPIGLGISTSNGIAKWNFSRIDRSASPLNASKARIARPQISQQPSFSASIHNSLPLNTSSLPRSASSGISISLLDCVSPNPKAALSSIQNQDANPTLKVPLSRRQNCVPQPTPFINSLDVFQMDPDMKSKRASTSVLQAVSDDQSSPARHHRTDRPSSIATEDPFRWNPTVRISNTPTIIPSSNPYRSTPTRKPSVQARSTQHPNRRRAIFPHRQG